MSKTLRESNRRQIVLKQAAQKMPFKKNGMSAQQIKDSFTKQPISRRPPVTTQRHRPPKAERKINHDSPELLIDIPSVGTRSSIEIPVPDWFKCSQKPDVSVVIPLYKSDDVIVDLIESWDLDNDGLIVEAIFVDDNCPHNSKDVVIRTWTNRRSELKSGVGKIIFNTENKGYGGACNTGAEYASGDYIIYLNADTKVTKGWVKPIFDLFKSDPKIGIIGNLQLKEKGTWHGTIDGAGSEWIWRSHSFVHIGRHSYHHQDLPAPMRPEDAPKDIMQVAEREMVTGCCLAIPTVLNRAIGGFNPNYRIGYWEDADICLTVREKGYKVFFQPNSVIWHKLSHTGSGGHGYQSFNKAYFTNKWVKSGRIDPLIADSRSNRGEVKQILVQRKGAHGDVLTASYVVEALKRKHPGATVTFHTKCPDVLVGHKHIHRVVREGEFSERQFQLVYNLDMAYEYRPFSNILECYADAVGVRPEDCEPYIHTEAYPDLPENFVTIHAGKTAWVGRDWDKGRFEEIAKRLISEGKTVVCVGRENDNLVPCHLDLRGKTSIQQLAYVISKSKFFIGIDSMPMHVAQAVNTPGLCYFGSITPESRIYRDNMHAITAKNIACLGCHHRRPVPSVVTNTCETGTLGCVFALSVDEVWSKVTALMPA